MKIAICFSGQPRTWAKCIDTWESVFEDLRKVHNAEIDVFMHAWTSNTPSHGTISSPDAPKYFLSDHGTPIPEDELNTLISRLNPKSVLLEDTKAGTKKILDTLSQGHRHDTYHGDTVISWAAPQFYSIMRAAHLKKKYEYENNFRYDICIRMRYDLYFDKIQALFLVNKDIKVPELNTVYPCHTSRDDSSFPFFRMGDILWYADSVAFDRVCDFYRWLPIIGSRSFGNKEVSTEHVLYFYIKMLRMQVSPMVVDPKIYRPADYLETKLNAGLPAILGNHELI